MAAGDVGEREGRAHFWQGMLVVAAVSTYTEDDLHVGEVTKGLRSVGRLYVALIVDVGVPSGVDWL